MKLLIRSLILISHIPLFKQQIQANFIDSLNILRPFIGFDVFGDIIEWDAVLQINEEAMSQFQDTFPA